MIRFLSLFLLLLLGGLYLQTVPEFKEFVSGQWGRSLAMLTHWLLSLFTDQVSHSGSILSFRDGAFSVSVDAECSGIDPLIIFWAAILAFPAAWGAKLKGILLGIAVIQGLNLVRIMSLLYLGRWNEAVFVWVHHNLWQGLLILAALLAFMYWQGTLGEQEDARSESDAGA